ncbi:hypothetical protein M422DRAFT_260276, partial [Sphaerobolus stellatus SS14]
EKVRRVTPRWRIVEPKQAVTQDEEVSEVDIAEDIPVTRHVLLEDKKRFLGLVQYVWKIYDCSRPANVEDIRQIQLIGHSGSSETQTVPKPGILPLHYSDCLHKWRGVKITESGSGLYPPILNIYDISRNLRIDVNLKYEAHDQRHYDPSTDSHIMYPSVADVVRAKYRAMNLNIRNQVSFISLDVAGQATSGPGFSHYDTKWNLLATAPSFSRLDYATKFCIWMRVQRGAKIVFILDSEVLSADIDFTKHRSIYFVMEEGAIL